MFSVLDAYPDGFRGGFVKDGLRVKTGFVSAGAEAEGAIDSGILVLLAGGVLSRDKASHNACLAMWISVCSLLSH